MHRRFLLESFNYAIEGFLYTLKTQRNMRIHFLSGVLALLLALLCSFSRAELVALLLTIVLVLLAEMINTGVELIIDLITNEFHPLARIIKDVAAGTVFVAALNALIVGYLLFMPRLPANTFQTAVEMIRDNPLHITFVSLLLVFTTVIFSKAKLRRGTPLRGGMPSGHAAVAFSVWTITLYLAPSKLLMGLTLFLAVLVAQSRVRPGYHSWREVLAGALLGVGMTAFIFFFLHLHL